MIKALQNPSRKLCLCVALLLNVIWALSYPLSKQIMNDIPPLTLTLYRTSIATLFLLPLFRRSALPIKFTRRDITIISAMCLTGCLGGMFLQYLGTHYTLASNVSFFVSLEPPLIAILSLVFLGEALGPRTGTALIIGFLGMVLMSVDLSSMDLIHNDYFFGNILVVGSMFSFATYNILGKLISDRIGAIELTTFLFFFSTIGFLLAIFFLTPQGFPEILLHFKRDYFGLLYIGVFATALAYMLWNWLLKWLTAVELGNSLLAQPILGAIFSYLLLGETLKLSGYLGAAFIIAALSWQMKISPTS